MIGTYDFCAHYEWTFAWLEAAGGEQLLQEYWTDAIGEDSQRHAAELIQGQGFEGMMKYWGHTLAEESPEKGYHMTQSPSMVRCDMHDCPSKGFLIKNNLQQYKDYCNHCIAWIRPVVERAGFRIDHEHNHQGQCWWEFREQENPSPASETGEVSGQQDVRHLPHWPQKEHHRFPEKSDSDKSQ